MSAVDEALAAKPPLGWTLADGLQTLSNHQTITFVPYVKVLLPADGFVFWVNATLLDPIPAVPKVVEGSFHYSTEIGQHEDANVAYNTAVFTSLFPIDAFTEESPELIYIGSFNGIRFAFSSRGKFYQQADLYHYVGTAIPSVMETQVVDDPSQIDMSDIIVSNSLPIWLGMMLYTPPYPGFTCDITLYPSFLTPLNLDPTYATVHIQDTRGLASSPFYTRNLTSQQLSAEKVRVTLYGANNLVATTFRDFVLQYSYDWNFIGILKDPVIIKDEKRTYSELGTIAQKKVIDFEISYLQSAARNVARQFIKHSHIRVIPNLYRYNILSTGTQVITDENDNPIAVGPVISRSTDILPEDVLSTGSQIITDDNGNPIAVE